MSSTTTRERTRSTFDSRRRPRRGAPRAAVRTAPDHGPRTLDELITAAVDRMERTTTADCPVCGRAQLTPAGCGSCGSHLS